MAPVVPVGSSQRAPPPAREQSSAGSGSVPPLDGRATRTTSACGPDPGRAGARGRRRDLERAALRGVSQCRASAAGPRCARGDRRPAAPVTGAWRFPEREVAVADAAGVSPQDETIPGPRVPFVLGDGAEGRVGAALGGGGHRGGVGGLDARSGPAAGDRGAVAAEALRGSQQGVPRGGPSGAMRGSALAGDSTTGDWGARRGRSGTHATRLRLSIAVTARGFLKPPGNVVPNARSDLVSDSPISTSGIPVSKMSLTTGCRREPA